MNKYYDYAVFKKDTKGKYQKINNLKTRSKAMNIYYIEYKNSIKFFGDGGIFELLKTKENYNKFKKVLDINKYNFISLI